MFLVVGLGNLGKKYDKTRHNIGFRVVEEFGKENGFSKFRISKKFNAETSEGFFNGEEIILAKPQTFMNLSGKSLKPLIAYYKIPTTNLWIVHDDIDLPLAKIRIAKNRGAAGHKGVESIIKELKTKNFIRFRVGIKPKTSNLGPESLDRFVLQKFNKDEEKIVKEIIQRTVLAIETALKKGLEKAMSKSNY